MSGPSKGHMLSKRIGQKAKIHLPKLRVGPHFWLDNKFPLGIITVFSSPNFGLWIYNVCGSGSLRWSVINLKWLIGFHPKPSVSNNNNNNINPSWPNVSSIQIPQNSQRLRSTKHELMTSNVKTQTPSWGFYKLIHSFNNYSWEFSQCKMP